MAYRHTYNCNQFVYSYATCTYMYARVIDVLFFFIYCKNKLFSVCSLYQFWWRDKSHTYQQLYDLSCVANIRFSLRSLIFRPPDNIENSAVTISFLYLTFMLRSVYLFLLFLPVAISRTLLVEIHCFQPRASLEVKSQNFTLCAFKQCQFFYFDHRLPLGDCGSSEQNNVPSRLQFNISKVSSPVLRVSAVFILRKMISVVRKSIVDVTFDLTNVNAWSGNGQRLPQSYTLNGGVWKIKANLSVRAAWVKQSDNEMITTLPSTTIRPIVVALPAWVLITGGLGIVAVLICLIVLIVVFARRRNKKKKEKNNCYEMHTPMQRIRTSTESNAYDVRESNIGNEGIYDDLIYNNALYENRERLAEDFTEYDDPGSMYTIMERQVSWNNDAYYVPPLSANSPSNSRTEQFSGNRKNWKAAMKRNGQWIEIQVMSRPAQEHQRKQQRSIRRKMLIIVCAERKSETFQWGYRTRRKLYIRRHSVVVLNIHYFKLLNLECLDFQWDKCVPLSKNLQFSPCCSISPVCSCAHFYPCKYSNPYVTRSSGESTNCRHVHAYIIG